MPRSAKRKPSALPMSEPITPKKRGRPVADKNKEVVRVISCAHCGREFRDYSKYFFSCKCEEWKGNSYHLPVCRECVEKLYEYYQRKYHGSERKALYRICMIFGFYYNEELLDKLTTGIVGESRVGAYIARTNLKVYAGKTFEDTLMEQHYGEDAQELAEETGKKTGKFAKSAIERWGKGIFNLEEYEILEEHYQMLRKNNPNIDNNQEIFVRDLCNIHLMKVRASKDKNLDAYTKACEQYSKIFSKAGLKTVEEKDTSGSDTLGVTLQVISQYTPEEFYRDKQLYKDYDELGEYYDRHVLRPMRNLMMGTDERDPEFHVPEDGD